MAEGKGKAAPERDEEELEREGETEGKAETEPEDDGGRDEHRDADQTGDGDEEKPHAGPVKSVLVVLGVIAFTLVGLWVFSGLIAPGYISSIVLGVLWFLLAAVRLGRFRKKRPHLTWQVRGAFIGTAVVVAALAAWTSVRDKTVHEQVVTGVKLSEAESTARVPEAPEKPPPPQNIETAAGEFEAAEEGSASGHAALVTLAAGGTKLTITDLDVAAGPDLRVYLAPGDGTDLSGKLDLGELKGNKGDQQYDVPEGTDTDHLHTVVVYCRAFSVAFGRAELKAQ
jgi:hypothetical protein